ncbi:MAG: DUF5996 family protein [Ignavibacteriaceae bacterium]|jgi:hypothetical protein
MLKLIFPPLILSEWKETRDTLQKYCRMVGAIREAISLPLPYSYHTNLLISNKGFTTSRLPKNISSPELTFEVILDLEHQRLIIESNFREPMRIALTGQSLNALCDETCSLMVDIGITPPLEKPSFLEGTRGRFDAEQLFNYWKAVQSVNQILNEIKTELGRDTSPIQLRPDDLTLVLSWFDKDFDDENSLEEQQTEIGFSTGNVAVSNAHFYISTFPDRKSFEKFSEQKNIITVNGGFQRVILLYDKALTNLNIEREIKEFFRRAF